MFMPILSSYLLTVEWNNFIMEISVLLPVIVPTKLSWLKFYTFGDRFMLSDSWDFGAVFVVTSSSLRYNPN